MHHGAYPYSGNVFIEVKMFEFLFTRLNHAYIFRRLTACAADPNNDALNWLFHDFLLPFGSLLASFGRLGRPFLDPGTTPGPFRARGAKRCEKITNWLNFGGSRGPHFETVLVKLLTF